MTNKNLLTPIKTTLSYCHNCLRADIVLELQLSQFYHKFLICSNCLESLKQLIHTYAIDQLNQNKKEEGR